MKYRGTLNIDFTGQDSNAYVRLAAALLDLGWKHVETSAFVRDDAALDQLWEGIGIVARFAGKVGPVSALTFHIQAAEIDFTSSKPLQTTQSGANAVREIKQMKFPLDP